MKSFSGYLKQDLGNNYVLLAGGSHKALSDFSMSGHNHDGRYLYCAGSAANATAMGWGTLTAANGYTILSHVSSSDGGDWGMVNKGGQISMQLDGYYYQNEGKYRVADISDLSNYLLLSGGNLTGNIGYTGSQATYTMITFINNTTDTYGNGIAIGGGGLTIIGGGESASVIAAQHTSGGDENMCIGNDQSIDFYSNLQNGWSSRKEMSFSTDGNLYIGGSKVWTASSLTLASAVSAVTYTPYSGDYTKQAVTNHWLAYWNGAHNTSGSSNLQYCDRGRFGTIITKGSGDYWPLFTDSYPCLRPGSSNNWIQIGTANTSYGLIPSQSGGAGNGHNYLGTSSWYWKYAYIDEIYGHLNGSVTMKANQYSPNYGINMNNSDIINVNSIYTADLSDEWGEGIQFKRSNGNWDSFRASDGSFYFGVNNGNENVIIEPLASNASPAVKLKGTSYVIGLHIGSGQVNRGIYDFSLNKWLIYFDGSNSYINHGGVYTTSDRRLKKNIQNIGTSSLERLFNTTDKLLKKFTWKSSGKDSYGFIAQELKEIIPEAVDEDTDGIMHVSYNVAYAKIIASLIYKIKDLENRIKQLEN